MYCAIVLYNCTVLPWMPVFCLGGNPICVPYQHSSLTTCVPCCTSIPIEQCCTAKVARKLRFVCTALKFKCNYICMQLPKLYVEAPPQGLHENHYIFIMIFWNGQYKLGSPPILYLEALHKTSQIVLGSSRHCLGCERGNTPGK